jgi:nitrite reductase/ring-hydroxylating ferredoxin subunit
VVVTAPQPARFPFSPFPSGWYTVAFSRELRRRALRSFKFAGQDVVLFRSASGRPGLLPAHCPHMGAHLGVGGELRGESLRCPMHGFEFDTEGHCTKTGYGTRPPPKCRAQAFPLLEQNGLVLAYHDALGRAPAWQPPEVDMRGFGPLRTHVLAGLPTHPQETTENSVDIGHLGAVHGYQNVRALDALATEGAYLTTRYGFTRRALLPGTPQTQVEITIHAYGLGYSYVDANVISHGLRTRHFVLATPTDGERIDLHVAGCVAGGGGLLSQVPGLLLDRAVGAVAFRNFLADVRQDLRIWSNKVYVHPPALAQGDGPIGRYRSWARQFYPEPLAGLQAAGVNKPD